MLHHMGLGAGSRGARTLAQGPAVSGWLASLDLGVGGCRVRGSGYLVFVVVFKTLCPMFRGFDVPWVAVLKSPGVQRPWDLPFHVTFRPCTPRCCMFK